MNYFVQLVFYFCLLVSFSWQEEEDNMLCTNEYCKKYLLSTSCPNIPQECKIQNSTHNGLILPYPGPCNCCEYCIKNLDEDDECVVGSPDSPPPNIICGDGLKCEKDKDGNSICIKNPTTCIQLQLDYDKRKKDGTLGHLELRPRCDKYGLFAPVMCIPGEICFCVDKEGNRIFGELPYSPLAEIHTKCECSRSISTINKLLLEDAYSIKRARCLPNGDYDSLQCVNRRCICVNSADASITDPSQVAVYMSLTSELPCFDENIHIYGGYLRSCEKEYNETLEMISDYEIHGFTGIIGYKLPTCQIDGKYAAIQQNDTHKYCASPDGDILESFILEIEKEENTKLINSMNCKCARARSINIGSEQPECCDNGNYASVQCRRGKCRCVNSNGMQSEQEPYMTLKGGGRAKLNAKIHKEIVEKDDDVQFEWKKKWGWLISEYKLMKEELSNLSTTSEKARMEIVDKRTLKPFPETVNQQYGWVCTKEDFKLERWGRDIWFSPPLPPDD